MTTNRVKQSEEYKKIMSKQNYFSQLKFMSIKSIMKNKKVIIKKTIPSDMFKGNIQNSGYQSAFFQDGETEQQNKKISQDESSFNHREKKRSSSQRNTNNSKGVVTIKFGQHYSLERPNKQYKNRKKLIPQGLMEDIKKNLEGQNQTVFFQQNKVLPFRQTLIVQPYKKNEIVLNLLSKKKSNATNGAYNLMSISKKNKKSSLGVVVGSNRTISNFASIGKHVQVPRVSKDQRQKTERKSCTATQKQKFQEKSERKISKKQYDPYETISKQQFKDFKDLLPIRKPNTKKDHFIFGLSDKPVTEGDNKIELYKDFLWKINFSNGIYILPSENYDQNYKAFVGWGNNSCMIKSILRRRFWWNVVEDKNQIENCNFVWTQLKINNIFKLQQQGQLKEGQTQQDEGKNKNYKTQDPHQKIFNKTDFRSWEKHFYRNQKTQQKLTEQTYLKRLNLFAKKDVQKIADSFRLKVHNHLNQNYYIGNKKALYYNFKRLCEYKGQNVFKYLPLTFHIRRGVDDPVYKQFLDVYEAMQETKKTDKTFRNIWIAKPGQNTNQGNGISVCFGLDDIRLRLRGRQKNYDGKMRTFILQQYIQKPFLYKNRKFDIRHYALVTCINGNYRAFWFQQGYIRTSSSLFNLKNMKDLLVHLTNDAVQKRSQEYGKYEKGNKLSYEDFQKYLDSNKFKKKYNFINKILPKMREITKLAIQSTYPLLDPERRQNNFQLLGLDFMLDQNFHPWLIEINTNPCLELSCPILERIIPNLIEQTFRLCLDPFFPPPENWTNPKKHFFGDNPLLQNKYELIFDEKTDGSYFSELHSGNQINLQNQLGKIQEDNDTFEDDGNDKWEVKQEL